MKQLHPHSEYSLSVYSDPGASASPDRPGTPSSFECYITLEGGRSSAAETSPSSLQAAKHERLTDGEEYRRAVYNASFLQAENGWLRRARTAGIALHEGTVVPAMESLDHGSDEIHDALTQFHIAFAAVEHALLLFPSPATSDLEATLQELIPAFETCRKGLDKVKTACKALEKGGRDFSIQLSESNRSYERFFGIGFQEETVTAGSNTVDM
ncbi:hypothetical protein Asppvi_005871 [Aspergillus pseudoviridinutans]|uniref:Uncharacterized protein n=1 Tax=Aspergillus pseudoviridinutans TaxID=1517512 RepID=A0A9P3B8Z6_9EURO|nr:uncharacterized protein Asppvi_005871 [Aspergillus pseudoviridinutans]GIJ86972.1 hypothetical protein Asppvi_005871 [Aspergillus pseudoviridinutans]